MPTEVLLDDGEPAPSSSAFTKLLSTPSSEEANNAAHINSEPPHYHFTSNPHDKTDAGAFSSTEPSPLLPPGVFNETKPNGASFATATSAPTAVPFKKGGGKAAPHRLVSGRVRYLILLLSILCMTATRSDELSFNFAVICMTAPKPSNASSVSAPQVAMRPGEISAVFGGSGIGALAMVLPVVYALHYFGPRAVFTVLMLCSAAATAALAPLAIYGGPLWMVPARVMQGLAISAVLPLMGCVSAEWAPLTEMARFMALLSTPGQLSQLLTMPLAAQLCVSSWGWPSVFYVHGTLSACLTLAFFTLYRSTPRKHPWVTAEELEHITQGVKTKRKRERRIPYAQILRSASVWAVWTAFLGASFGVQLIVQFMPTFLNKVLHVPIARTGLASIAPALSQLGVKVIAGWGSDRLPAGISELTKLRVFNTLAMMGCGASLLPLGFLIPEADSEGLAPSSASATYAVLCFTASISSLGMVTVGAMKSATLVARNYTHFLMGVVQIVACMSMLSVPMMVSWLAPNNSSAEWRIVFFIVFCILSVANLVFCLFCAAEPEPWAFASSSNSVPAFEEAVALAPTGDSIVPSGVTKGEANDDGVD